MNILKVFTLGVMVGSLAGCSTLDYLKYDKEDRLRQNRDFDQKVVVKEIADDSGQTGAPLAPKSDEKSPVTPVQTVEKPALIPPANAAVQTTTKKPAVKKSKTAKSTPPVSTEVAVNENSASPKGRQPDIEDSEGFDGLRRPKTDPFTVGEKVVHSVSYFSAEAGKLTLEVRPFVEVNSRKSYNFFMGLKTSSLFSKFYSVDDSVETYVDYQNLIPHVFKINVRESGKLMQGNSYFDNQKLRAQYWEKKYTEKSGEEEKKLDWEILPFSQNAFSGIFYMRIFKWDIGKEYSFRVADDEKNIIFKATALEKEKLKTDAGEFNAIKIKASVVTRGAMTQTGAFFIWLSDDDRKVVLRIEAEIKIGKIVSEIVEYKRGR